jgi:hypothetical protein
MTSRSYWLGALGSAVLLGGVLGGCATTLSAPPVATPSGAETAIPSGASGPGAIEIAPGDSGSGSDEPTVCTFYFDFTMGANRSGTYVVKTLRSSKLVMNGTWATGEVPNVRVPAEPNTYSLPEGEYVASWAQYGAHAGDKRFQVACQAAGRPG